MVYASATFEQISSIPSEDNEPKWNFVNNQET